MREKNISNFNFLICGINGLQLCGGDKNSIIEFDSFEHNGVLGIEYRGKVYSLKVPHYKRGGIHIVNGKLKFIRSR